MELGIDITKEPIPVVPATHFTCGGVVTDTLGRTDIRNLYAVGETACTGLHGANRLASNSLLECLVIGKMAAEHIASLPREPFHQLPQWDESRVSNANEEVVISHNWDELRRFMWNYVGIVRTTKRLERAQRRIHLLREEIDEGAISSALIDGSMFRDEESAPFCYFFDGEIDEIKMIVEDMNYYYAHRLCEKSASKMFTLKTYYRLGGLRFVWRALRRR